MAEGLRLKDLPEECILNISSFLIGKPHELKLKHNNKFKQIQKKNKLDIREKDELWWILKRYRAEEKIKKTEYGYYIWNYNKVIKSFQQALGIIRSQFDKLYSLIRHSGETRLFIFLNYYGYGIEAGDVCFPFESYELNNKTDFYRLLTQKTDELYVVESNGMMFNLNLLKIHSIFFSFENETIHID